MFAVDFAAVDGASRAWRTEHGTLTELLYGTSAGQYTWYSGYHADIGSVLAGRLVGLSAPAAQTHSFLVVEVCGPETKKNYATNNPKPTLRYQEPSSA